MDRQVPVEPAVTSINSGDLRGAIYDFARAGDVLRMHRHGSDDVHISVVARGRFRCRGSFPQGEVELAEGVFVDWDAGVDHEFTALTDNARLVNIIKKAL
jgi:quercetin dioxygenase-like cupin family protein